MQVEAYSSAVTAFSAPQVVQEGSLRCCRQVDLSLLCVCMRVTGMWSPSVELRHQIQSRPQGNPVLAEMLEQNDIDIVGIIAKASGVVQARLWDAIASNYCKQLLQARSGMQRKQRHYALACAGWSADGSACV